MKVEINMERSELGSLLKLKGDVDMNSSPDLRAALGKILKEGGSSGKALFVNLSQVRYMDSSGIATLVEALQACMKQGIRLRLVELSPPVRDVFELARLSGVFEIFSSMDEAKQGL